jgi:hypothetical protein
MNGNEVHHFSRGLALIFALGICASIDVAAAQEKWATYMNPRFGTIVDYPANIFTDRDPPPENGDGQSFRSGDGHAQLLIYGAYNAEGDTPQSYVEKHADEGVSYRRTTARTYVISGTRKDELFYERCNFQEGKSDIINCFTVTYPGAEKVAWDPIVTRLSKSLRAGRGRH